MRVFHSHTVAIHLLSFLFLPGVVLHELSHLLVANILFVRTGEIEFFPEIHGNEVKMGSVAIEKTDPFRRFLIGVAPVFGGLGIMLLLFSFLSGHMMSWQGVLLLYSVFEITNTMFSSGKDMEGAMGLVVAIVVCGGVLQALHVQLFSLISSFFQTKEVAVVFSEINIFLLIALGIDMFLVLFFEGLSRLRIKNTVR